MKHATNCKFCQIPITLEIEDSYAALGDPMKLIPFAACNRCADLRVRRRIIESEIKRSVAPLIIAPIATAEQNSTARERLIPLTKKYATLIADWVGSKTSQWETSIPESIIENPEQWTNILSRLWKIHKQPSLV